MKCFRYKLEHDYGFAPNPFHGILTLATCKPKIRNNKNLRIEDWIIGLGSVSMGNLDKLIFAMQVEEIITFDQYWNDKRFECKKPILNGSLVQLYGDNVYHTDPKTNEVIQEKCAHSNDDNSVNLDHKNRDVSGINVLLSHRFYYFGDNCPEIPDEFSYIKLGSKIRHLQFKDLIGKDKEINDFISWIESNYNVGIHGDPCNWKEYNLPKLNIYDDGIQ